MNRIFITGIGTGVGKTVAAACMTEALEADYWKPIQAGLAEGTDRETVRLLLSNKASVCYPETYVLQAAASPHLAASQEKVIINIHQVIAQVNRLQPVSKPLVIEGAGGLLVPVNQTVFMLDLIVLLQAKVVIVAQNYLGSINHALLTAKMLQHTGVPVIGWIFSGHYHSNEEDIVKWSGFPKIGRISQANYIDKDFVKQQAQLLKASLHTLV